MGDRLDHTEGTPQGRGWGSRATKEGPPLTAWRVRPRHRAAQSPGLGGRGLRCLEPKARTQWVGSTMAGATEQPEAGVWGWGRGGLCGWDN